VGDEAVAVGKEQAELLRGSSLGMMA